MRITRSALLEVMRQDYIRTAWSKRLSERKIVLRHELKNALIPVVTLVGLQDLRARHQEREPHPRPHRGPRRGA